MNGKADRLEAYPTGVHLLLTAEEDRSIAWTPCVVSHCNLIGAPSLLVRQL